MKFEVKYFPYAIDFWQEYGLEFWGKGWVFVNDTALIFQGNAPKFNLSVLLPIFGAFYQKFLYVSTTTTVPYATIIKHKKPGFLRKAHEITYRLPNDKNVTVKFQMTKSKKRHDEMFTSQLEEYLAVAQSFVIS